MSLYLLRMHSSLGVPNLLYIHRIDQSNVLGTRSLVTKLGRREEITVPMSHSVVPTVQSTLHPNAMVF